MKRITEFPFLPKSSAKLLAGMIWDIRLRDGSFACGRVLSIASKLWPQQRFVFWGGLLSWHGVRCPTVDSIFGAPIMWQGHFDVRSLANSDSQIRDILPLETDGLVIPPILTTLMNGEVMIGYDRFRPATDEEFRTLPIKNLGENNRSFREIAEDVFLDGKPMRVNRCTLDNHLLDRFGLVVPGDLSRVENEVASEWLSKKKAKTTRRKN